MTTDIEASRVAGSSSRRTSVSASITRHRSFVDLPGEILSQIASYLPFEQLIPYLSLHPNLLTLTRSHLSPWPKAIRKSLLAGPPYPHLLGVLPSLRCLLPSDGDDGRLFVDVLVRARPKWILERLEMGHWKDSIWKEAFDKRFLPGWKAFRKDGDSWRAIFLRILSRLEHRNLGCTHEESWTRFVTIHRNGSAGINRYYSRLFDPYDIYEELKSQNNFASLPTQVRVVVHLQDVRVLAIGVLTSEPTLFVNANAHSILHPPLLRDLSTPLDYRSPSVITNSRKVHTKSPNGAIANEAYFPLVRSLSPSTPSTTTYGLGDGLASPPQSPLVSSPPAASGFSRFVPGRRRRNTSSEEVTRGADLVPIRSRDSDEGRRRSWASVLTRTRSGSIGNTLERTLSTSQPVAMTSPTLAAVGEQSPDEALDEVEIDGVVEPSHLDSSVETGRGMSRPYPTVQKPLPAPSHELYPNFTPSTPRSTSEATATSESEEVTSDVRMTHPEVEDDYNGNLWAREDTHQDEVRMVEWNEARGRRERWVGPMLLVAQLHPATRQQPYPQSATPGPTEGPNPDLGPKGMYASLDFEDVKALLPWVEFKGGGAFHTEAMRSGLGYE